MIEVCAGLLDEDDPDTCIKREALEETGYKIEAVTQVMKTYMSPGAVTEILYLYTARYTPEMKLGHGGGVAGEQEEIDVMEVDFTQALDMIRTGDIQDAKTIMLLQYAAIQGLLRS